MASRSQTRENPDKNQRRKPKQARAREKYLAVLEACTQVLAQRGYQRATMMELSLTSGVAVPTIYQYFDNKESIVLAWFENMVEQVLAKLLAEVGQIDDDKLKENIGPLIERAVTLIANFHPAIRRVFNDLPSLMSSRLVSAMESKTLIFVHALKTPGVLALDQEILDRKLALLVRCVLGYIIMSVFSDRQPPDRTSEAAELTSMICSYLSDSGVLQG